MKIEPLKKGATQKSNSLRVKFTNYCTHLSSRQGDSDPLVSGDNGASNPTPHAFGGED